jgi:hemolysin activation/secretion protein
LLKPLIGALALASLHAQAQTGVPNSGTILQQMRPTPPAAPNSNQAGLQVKPAQAGAMPASVPFKVQSIRIVGNTEFSADTLHALVADVEGKTLTLAQLAEVAGRITAWYQQHGFPLSRAVIPAQTIENGAVSIQVLEARYGDVQLKNTSRVGDALLAASARPLQGGRPIAEHELDRTLLLLSDIPGVAVNAVLKPGSVVGTSDLEIDTDARANSVTSLSLDNYGNRYIGRARVGANVDVFNPFHHGDIVSASIVTTGKGLAFGRLGYDTLLDGGGTRVGVAYSAVRYRLKQDFEAIDANGTAGVASAWVKHPLIRTKESNLYVQLQYDAKRLRDRVNVTSTRTDRHLDNWILTLNGDLRDNLLAGGVSIWSVGWTRGHNGFDDVDAAAADALSAQTRGNSSKWNVNLSRIQGLTPHDTLYLNAAAQWTNANLDSSEKMTVGGPYTVRAYDLGAIASDAGYFGSVELRHDLGEAGASRWQATAFVESAHVKLNRHPWAASENVATLSGAGLGLNWESAGGWRANLSVAAPIGSRPSMADKPSSVRGWFTASKAF